MSAQRTIPAGDRRPATAQVAQIRLNLEAAIEEAIALLDSLDGDSDVEDGGDDEPSLSSLSDLRQPSGPIAGPSGFGGLVCLDTLRSQCAWAVGADDDREDDSEEAGTEPGCDYWMAFSGPGDDNSKAA